MQAFNAKKFPSLFEMEIFYTLNFSFLSFFTAFSYAAFNIQERAMQAAKEMIKQINAVTGFGMNFKSVL